MLTLLYITGLGVAAFIGLIVGAGLIRAEQIHASEELQAERESVLKLVEASLTAHADICELVRVNDEVAHYNAQILVILQNAAKASEVAALASLGRTGKPN
jgi:hypothetical protein